MKTVLAEIDFNAPSHEVAQRLIGTVLLVGGVGGRIVETEAYDREDPASHSFSGPTERNGVMFGPPAHAYVYRSYGIHWCLNFVCCEPGHGAGVLIRALEPLAGVEEMRVRRDAADADLRWLCSGPGRLSQALGVTRAHNGLALAAPPFALAPRAQPVQLVAGPRIGLPAARRSSGSWKPASGSACSSGAAPDSSVPSILKIETALARLMVCSCRLAAAAAACSTSAAFCWVMSSIWPTA